jgi:SOS-response transcriptional repressor LexA
MEQKNNIYAKRLAPDQHSNGKDDRGKKLPFGSKRDNCSILLVTGDSMLNAGIYRGDRLLVDRAQQPVNGNIVIAIFNAEMLIRRYHKTNNNITLSPEGANLASISIIEGRESCIWGVAVSIIRDI